MSGSFTVVLESVTKKLANKMLLESLEMIPRREIR